MPGPVSALAKYARGMGGPRGNSDWREMGTWRIELQPENRSARDLFLNVMYLGDADEKMPPVELVDEGSAVGCRIDDDTIKVKLVLNRTGPPGGHITIERDGRSIDRELPQRIINRPAPTRPAPKR